MNLLRERIRLWWHCLWRLHRAEEATRGIEGADSYRTIYLGCADCGFAVYGERPEWIDRQRASRCGG